MSLVPLQHRLELFLNGVWVDVSTYLLDKPISHPTGTGDEARRLQPATFGFELDNSDGRFTPGNPTSPYYPYLTLNTPVRWSIAAGLPHLTTTGASGSRASTPDDSSLDITSDWFGAVEVEPGYTLPGAGLFAEVIAKRNTTGNQRSILLLIGETGSLFLLWSTDGTSANERQAGSATPVPFYLWDTFAVAWWLDVNNGAGGVTVTFYAAPTLDDILADPIGTILATDTSAGTSSVFNSSAPLELGDSAGTGFAPFAAKYRRAQVRAGDSTGAIRTNPDFTTQAVGATSFVDSAGRTWTVNSPAAIDKWQTRQVGEVVSINPNWTPGDPGLPTVKVTAASVTRRLGQRRKALKSPLTRQITSPYWSQFVTAHWPLEDGSDSPQAASSTPGARPMVIGGDFRLGAASRLPSTASVAQVSGGQSYGFNATVPPSPAGSGTDWRLSWLVDVPAVNATTFPLMVVTTEHTARTWVLQANSTQWTITALDSVGAGLVLDTRAWTTDFQYPSIIHMRAAQNGGNIDWSVDWIPLQGNFAGFAFTESGSFAGTWGRMTRVACLGSVAPPDGFSMGQVAVSTGTTINWLAPGDSAFVGESAAARYKRLCDEEGIPVIIEGDAADSPAMGPQPIATILDVLQDCAETDGGIQVEQRHAAGVGLRTLRSMYNQTPRLSLDAARIVSGEVHGDLDLPFTPVLDDQRIINDVTAGRPNGSSVRVTTTPPPDDDKTYSGEVNANVEADAALLDVASWAMHHGTTPFERLWMRYPDVKSSLIDRDYLVEDYLHTGPGDTFEVENIPQHAPDAVVLLQEGGTESADTTTWDIGLVSSPGLLYEVGVRDDPNRGKRDSKTSTLASSFVAGTATSMSVAVASGLLWTTAAGEMPIELDVGGARITCTAIAGGSSPQTFTVSATVVNGVAKTVPAGTKVRLWRPTVRAR